MKCTNCGNENNADTLFCGFCGSKLKSGKNKPRVIMIIGGIVAVILLLGLGSLLYFLVSAIKGPADDNYKKPEKTEHAAEPEVVSDSDEVSEITESDNNNNEDDTVEEDAVEDAASEYIIPDSDKRYLSKSELASLSSDELRIARNEIFARHGRRFNDAALQSHFDSCSWYKGTIAPANFNEAVFNEYEKANVNLISSVENERK